MSDLIERLEKAMGPDRELDIEIFEAVTPLSQRTDRRGVMKQELPGYGNAYMKRRCLFYTASIDGAVTLVPEGWAWQCGCECDLTPVGRVQGPDVGFAEFGATPAIAICIAALKAREALAASEREGS